MTIGRRKQSYRLTAHLYSPPVLKDPITLDAIVAYVMAKTNPGWKRAIKPGCLPHVNIYETRFVDLIGHDEGGVPLTTWNLNMNGQIYITSVRRRFENKRDLVKMADFGSARRRINVSSGPYRSWDLPLPCHSDMLLCWDFIGDGPAVQKLLEDYVVGVGKKIVEGYGWVDRWDLKERDITALDILKARPVPVKIAHRRNIIGPVRKVAWRSPYWELKNREECVVPIEDNQFNILRYEKEPELKK